MIEIKFTGDAALIRAQMLELLGGPAVVVEQQGYNAYRDWIGEPASSNAESYADHCAQVAEPLTADEQVDFPAPAEEPKKRRTRKAKSEPETVEQPTIDAVAETPPEPEPEETTTGMDAVAAAPEEIAPIDFPSEPLDMKPVTLEDLRAAFTGIYSRAPNRTAGQEAIMAVLGKFKAKNASGVAPEQLADAIAECNAQFAK